MAIAHRLGTQLKINERRGYKAAMKEFDFPSSKNSPMDSCPTFLVHDTPATDDSFGPHRKVAHAIAKLVTSEDGGRSIGISGKWGSGKSTVINLLRKELSKLEDVKVWVFDAWAHEGDPLRRIFLESLIGFLREKKWVVENRWKEKVEELSRRRKITNQTNYPSLSFTGWLLGISIILIPLGVTFLAQGLRDGVTFSRNSGPLNMLFVVGIFFTLLPIFFLIGKILLEEARYRIKKGEKGKRPQYRELLAILVNKAVIDTKSETIETDDPTSIEFENNFAELMSEALSKANRRLVLVIDNLDRIDAPDALKIWSTLQTFSQQGPTHRVWLPNLWVIMPFDHDSIVKIWEKDIEHDGKLAESFLDKSFQIRFEVPAPLMSDWHEFMLSTLKAAFPKHEHEDFHPIYRLLAVFCEEENRTPTPREIKLLANQIGALHRQHGDSVLLAHMAYYVLLTRRRSDKNTSINDKDILRKIILREIPEESVAGLVGEEVGNSLAVLIFGVELARAQLLLLQPSMVEALANGDGESLKNMRSAPGFLGVLEQTVTRAGVDWPKSEGEKILNAVVALHDLSQEDPSENYRINALFRELASAAGRIEKILPQNETADRGFVLLVTKVQDRALAKYLYDAYALAIKSSKALSSPNEVSNLAIRMAGLSSQLHMAGFIEAYAAGIELPCDINTFFQSIGPIAIDASEDQMKALKTLRPSVSDVLTAKSLQEITTAGKLRGEHSATITILKSYIGKGTWKPVIDAIRTRLNGNNNIVPDEANPLLATLIELGDVPEGEQALRTLVVEGSIASHIANAVSGKNTEMMARCLFIYMSAVPTLAKQGDVNQSGTGYQEIRKWQMTPPKGLGEELAKLLIRGKREELLFGVLDKTPGAANLVGETLAVIDSSDTGRKFLTPEIILNRWSLIEAHFDPDVLAKRFAGDGRLSVLSIQDGFQGERTSLYKAIVESCPEDTKFRDWCAEELRKIESNAWLEEIQSDDSRFISLALACKENGVQLNLKQPFLDALHIHATKLVKNEVEKPPRGDDWPVLLELLYKTGRVFFFDQLYDLLQSNAGQVGEAFFVIYGNAIPPDGLHNDPSVVTKVLNPMIDSRNAPGLQWARDRFAEDPKILDKVKDEHREVFIHRLQEELVGNKNDDANKYLREIARLLQVQAPMPPESEEPSSTS